MASAPEYTFDPSLSTDRDKVRLLLQDTEAPFDLSDEAIDWLLTTNSVWEAARKACLMLIARYSRQGESRSIGPFSIDFGAKVQHYQQVHAMLEVEGKRSSCPLPFLSGADEPTFASKGIHDYTHDQGPTPEGW